MFAFLSFFTCSRPVAVASAALPPPAWLLFTCRAQGVSELFTTAFFFFLSFLLFMFLNVFLVLISTTYSRFPFSLNVMTNDPLLPALSQRLRTTSLHACSLPPSPVCKYISYFFTIALSKVNPDFLLRPLFGVILWLVLFYFYNCPLSSIYLFFTFFHAICWPKNISSLFKTTSLDIRFKMHFSYSTFSNFDAMYDKIPSCS